MVEEILGSEGGGIAEVAILAVVAGAQVANLRSVLWFCAGCELRFVCCFARRLKNEYICR